MREEYPYIVIDADSQVCPVRKFFTKGMDIDDQQDKGEAQPVYGLRLKFIKITPPQRLEVRYS